MSFPFVGTHTAAEWATWYRTNAEITDDGIAIATDPYPSYSSPHPVSESQGFDAVDVAVDRCGTAFVLAADGSVYRHDPTLERLDYLECVWDPDDGGICDPDGDGEPTAIAVTDDTLYVADRATGVVQAVSVHLRATRWIADAFADPVGLTTSEGRVYVLDATDPATPPTRREKRLVRLGPRHETTTVARHAFEPIDVASDAAGNVVVLGRQPSTGSVIELFEPPSLTDAEETGVTADIHLGTEMFRRVGAGGSVVPTCVEAVGVGEIVVGVGEDVPGEPTLFRYRPDRQGFERLPVFADSAIALQTGRTGRDGDDPPLYVVDENGTISRLEGASGPRQRNDGGYDAQVVGRFDAGEPGIQWHRVTMDLDRGSARTPSRTQVRLQYAATEDDWEPARGGTAPTASPGVVAGIGPTYTRRLSDADVNDLADLVALTPGELALVLRTDSNPVSMHTAAGFLADARAHLGRTPEIDVDRFEWRDLGRPNPSDALLSDAEGRYLWIRIRLVGDDRHTPRVDSCRAYFPRRSYLRYLPAVYREDRASAAFLERYLSVFESTFVDIEEDIDASSKFADARGIPADHVAWLGEWLAVEADEAWPPAAIRALIQAAPELYRMRGTAAGLLATIRLYLQHIDAGVTPRDPGLDSVERPAASDPADEPGETNGHAAAGEQSSQVVYLVEHGDLSCIDDEEVREHYERLLSCRQGFLVLLHPDVSDDAAAAIERIVEAQQPAHAAGRTVHLRPLITLTGTAADRDDPRGFHTYLGINSRLSDRELALGEAGLGQDSLLVEREPDGHLEHQSRLGRDTRLS